MNLTDKYISQINKNTNLNKFLLNIDFNSLSLSDIAKIFNKIDIVFDGDWFKLVNNTDTLIYLVETFTNNKNIDNFEDLNSLGLYYLILNKEALYYFLDKEIVNVFIVNNIIVNEEIIKDNLLDKYIDNKNIFDKIIEILVDNKFNTVQYNILSGNLDKYNKYISQNFIKKLLLDYKDSIKQIVDETFDYSRDSLSFIFELNIIDDIIQSNKSLINSIIDNDNKHSILITYFNIIKKVYNKYPNYFNIDILIKDFKYFSNKYSDRYIIEIYENLLSYNNDICNDINYMVKNINHNLNSKKIFNNRIENIINSTFTQKEKIERLSIIFLKILNSNFFDKNTVLSKLYNNENLYIISSSIIYLSYLYKNIDQLNIDDSSRFNLYKLFKHMDKDIYNNILNQSIIYIENIKNVIDIIDNSR